MSVTGNKQISFEVKNQLAKLLATENITMMHNPSARTAHFDVKSRQLVLPVWQNISEDLYDMLVVHEVGHALYSHADKWLSAITDIAYNNHQDRNPANSVLNKIKGYLNVVEDARIDKLQKRRYPGSKRNYSIGYKELNDKDFFGIQNKDINGMAFIDRANIYFKSTGIHIKFTSEERVFIRRMENAETFEDVVQITDELYAFARAENVKKQEEKQQQQGSEDEESEEDMDMSDDMDSDGSDESDEFEDDDLSGTASDSDDSDESDEFEDDTSAGASEKDDEDEDEGASEAEDAPLSETYEASEKSLSKIINDQDVNYIYLNVPKFNHTVIVDDYKIVLPQIEAEFQKYAYDLEATKRKAWQQKENDTISYMVKEFEMRKSAEAYARIATAKTGVIDTNKLPMYKFTDDIFKKVTTIPKGENHGFVMFLDWSGSMGPNLMNTMKQLFSLTMFCKRVNIPFEVYLFRTEYTNSYDIYDKKDEKTLRFPGNGFKIRNILSSRMDINTLNKAYNLMWLCAHVRWVRCDRLDSTPLNETILAADKLVNEFRARNKVQIVNTIFLTDGSSDYTGLTSSGFTYKKGGNKYIIRDEVTNKTYWVDDKKPYGATSAYLRILKDRTNSNMIGFFLYDSARLDSIASAGIVDQSVVDNDAVQKCWKDNDFVGVESAGYDEYYIIRTRKDKVVDELNVSSSMTKGAIARSFIKFSERKTINRVMLSKFMEKVSTSSF